MRGRRRPEQSPDGDRHADPDARAHPDAGSQRAARRKRLPQALPPSITRFNVKIHFKQRDYWVIDSTPLVSDANYCRRIGYSDRSTCPLRNPDSADREACELWRSGTAKDTGKPGPTWTVTLKDGTTSYCTGPTGPCDHYPDLPFDVKAYLGGRYKVCTEDGGACGQVDVDRNL